MRFDPSCRDSTRATHRRLNCQPGRADVKVFFGLVARIVHRSSYLVACAVLDSALHPPFHSGACEWRAGDMGQTRSAVRMLSRRNTFSGRANNTTKPCFHAEVKFAEICLSFGEEITGYLWLSAPWKPAKHWSCSPSLSSSPSSPKQCHTDSWGSSRRATWGSTGVWVLLTPGRLLGFLGLFFNDL